MTDEVVKLLPEAFVKMQDIVTVADKMKSVNAQLSGTTATLAIHDHKKNKLIISHVADSTCVIGSYKGEVLKGEPLTRDHKPDLQDEQDRINKGGGRVIFDGYANHRVYSNGKRYPGLNMSRCLGTLRATRSAA